MRCGISRTSRNVVQHLLPKFQGQSDDTDRYAGYGLPLPSIYLRSGERLEKIGITEQSRQDAYIFRHPKSIDDVERSNHGDI